MQNMATSEVKSKSTLRIASTQTANLIVCFKNSKVNVLDSKKISSCDSRYSSTQNSYSHGFTQIRSAALPTESSLEFLNLPQRTYEKVYYKFLLDRHSNVSTRRFPNFADPA